MSEKNNNSVNVKQALLDYKDIEVMIKESSKISVKDILSETVNAELKNLIKENNKYVVEDIDEEDKEIEGMEDTTEPEVETEIETQETEPEVEIETEVEEPTDEPEIDFEQFKTDEDDMYDLTNSPIEDVLKVFKKVKPEDSVIVTTLGDGKINLKDDESDEEYIIDLGEEESEVELGETKCYEEDADIVVEEDTMLEIELGPEEEGEGEIDEKNLTQSYSANRRSGVLSQTRAEYAPGENKRDGSQLVSETKLVEKLNKMYSKKLNAIKEENQQLKEALGLFRDKLKENAVLNNNLGKYVKLVTENTTNKNEKVSILERYQNVKSIEEGNQLFETIQKELSTNKKPSLAEEKKFTTEPSKLIKEQVMYESDELGKIRGLMSKLDKK
jgi:hypothetical protein